MIFTVRKAALCLISSLVTLSVFAFPLGPAQALIPLQVGMYFSSQGYSGHYVYIKDIIGDEFNSTNTNSQNGLFGLGYYLFGAEVNALTLFYGFNAYYLAPVSSNGTIVQERKFTNLAYRYSVTNYPIYFAAKAIVANSNPRYNLTLDLGLGPNVVNTSDVEESSLDGGITIPNRAFGGQTKTVFSASAGLGIRFNNILGQLPIECGYRFFYLSQGSFEPLSDQIINKLNTGTNYANAVICSVTV